MQFRTIALLTGALYASLGFAAAVPTVSVQSSNNSTAIPNSYIVIYKPGVSNSTAEQHQNDVHDTSQQRNDTNDGVTDSYNFHGIRGYSVQCDNKTVKDIANSGLVALIEKDGPVKMTGYVSQSNAPWSLQRISHRYFSNTSYTYDNSAGAGTYAYILDTGIYTSHADFKGHASWGANFVPGAPDTDDNGHGTHCAGTVGSQTYGIAKGTNLIAVKVLDSTGSGSYSNVISGLQWVVQDATAKGRIGSTVISMSLAGGFSATLNAAVNAVYAAGIPVIVAAGNSGADASGYSPASAQYAITVGATDDTDTRPSWSNYGAPLTIFAPGVNIVSTWNSCPTCNNTVSGTSMSAPHVAGMAAYLIKKESLKSPADVVRVLKYFSIGGIVKNAGQGSTSNLLFNGNGDNN
jgi:oryzin